MDQRERLIELLRDTFNYTKGVCVDFDEAVEINADYLLASGVVVPPCKVGDTLYVQWSYTSVLKKNIYPVKVYALRFDTKKNKMRICVKGKFKITDYGGEFTHYYNGTFPWDSVGKTVFLTREEAEAELERRMK